MHPTITQPFSFAGFFPDKAFLHAEGLDRAGALDRLAKVREDGRPGDGLEPLELPRGGDEYPLDDVEEHPEREQDQDEVGDGGDDQDDGGERLEEDAEPVLDDPGEDVVAHVHVLGEAVHYPADRRGVKVRHRGPQNAL